MKLKMKALKWWQGLLIAVAGVALAIGGVFLYVYFTSGIGAKKVYPEDISFEIKNENGQTLEGYNEELGQFEMSENFSMRIGTQTEGVNKKTLTLSFTSNFTETAVDGYITNGVISIPQKVTIGQDFEVKVEKDNDWNIGGISTIYASTENKLLLPTSAKIAIDVPVKNIGTKIEDTSSSRIYEAKDGVFSIIKDTNVRISALFTPEDSQYIFSDNKASKEDKRVKNYFIEVLEGADNFVMNRDSEGIYFTSAGALDSTAKIKIYTFKNSKDQLDFYSTFNEGISEEEIYNSAIVELSQKPEKACVVEANIKIVEATVSEFKVSRTQKMDLNTNKLYTIRANSNTYSNLVLGTTILDDMKEPVSAMISKVAMRILKKVDENWVETDEVELIGGNRVSIEGANYTFINANVRDLNNAYWEISSKEDGTEYRAEIVLLISDGGYKIFNNQTYSFDISFKENVDASVSWKVDDTALNMIVFPGQNASSTQYEKKLNELISVPTQNVYQRVVYLAYHDNWRNTSEEEAKNYLTIKSFKDYSFSKTDGGTETFYMAELDSPYLLIKKGIEGLKIRFITVKTDAYGNVLLDENGKYQIAKWSNDITVNALEMISGFSENNMEILTTNCDNYNKDGLKRYILSKDKTMQFKINLDATQAPLFIKQYNQGLISFKVFDFENKMEYSDLIETITFDEETLIFTVKFKDSIATSSDRLITFKLNYNPTSDISQTYEIRVKNSETNDVGYLTVYESSPKTIENGLKASYSVKAKQAGADWNITINGTTLDEINNKISLTKVFDKYGIDVTEKFPINLSTSNSRILEVNADKTISFNNNLSDETENVTLSINSGSAEGKNVTFTFTAAKVTKIEYLKDTEDNQEGDNSLSRENTETKITDLNSVTIRKLGYTGNKVTLKNLLKVYTGISATEYKEYTNLSFRLRDIAGMGENKKYLIGSGGMFEMTTDDATDTDITTETNITSITVKHDFYGDYTLKMRVEGLGISIDLDIVFMNNVTATCQLPSTYNQGKTTVSKPEDVVIDNVTYTGVYADYGINMDEVFKVTKTKGDSTPGNTSLSWKNGVIDGAGVTKSGTTLTFDTVYSPTDVVFTIYEVNKNPFAFNQSFKCYVYPNIQYNSKKGTLNFEDIASGGNKGIGEYFSVCKYVYTENEVPSIGELTYEIKNEETMAVTIKQNNSMGYVFKRNDGVKLNLYNGATEKAFEVSVKNSNSVVQDYKGEDIVNSVVQDYKGEDIVIPMSLSLENPYEALIENNADYLSKVKYDGKEVVMLKYTTVGELQLKTTKKENDSSTETSIVGGYDFDIIGTENTSIIQKLSEQKFQIIGLTEILSYGSNFYLPITMKAVEGSGETKITKDVATFRIPLLISRVDSIYAYYKNYNGNAVDRKVLLSGATDLKNFPQDIFAEFSAGTNPIVVHAAKITSVDNKITVNGKAYTWEFNDTNKKLILKVEEDEKATSEGNKIKIDGAEYSWKVEGEGESKTLVLTIKTPAMEGFYLPLSGEWTSNLSVLSEQTLIKLTSEQIAGRIPGKNITLKLTNGSNEIYSSWDKIKLGETSYTWKVTDGKLVLTNGSSPITEGDNGKIVVGSTAYDISYWMLTEASDTGLVKINDKADKRISISSLANVDRFVVLQLEASSTIGSFSYIYRIKVTHDLEISRQYPYGGNVEYLGVDGTLTKDLSALENGKHRFVVNEKEQNSSPSTNSIKSITVNNKEYTIGGVLYNLVFEENAGIRTYKAGSAVTISFNGDKMTISTVEKNVSVVMVKSYDGVVNGELEYSFLLNVSDKKYVINLDKNTIDHNGTVERTLNPGGEQTFTALTMTKSGSTETGVGDNVSTIISVGAGFTLEKTGTAGTAETYNLNGKKTSTGAEEKIATITYDPKAPTENLKITPSGSFTEPVTFDLLFAAQEMEDGNIILNQSNIATIRFTIDRTIKITENTAQLYGGKTYNFVGTTIEEEISTTGLIKEVLKFNSGTAQYVKDLSGSNISISVECKDKGTNETAKFVIIDDTNLKVKFAMLKEDKKVEFTVTITDNSATEASKPTYEFTFTRTLAKSVTYADGKDLASNKDNAYIYNEKREQTSGTETKIDFNEFATHSSETTFSNETFAIASVNGSTTTDNLSSGGYKVEISESKGQLTITPENVAIRQVRSYAIEIRYTFNYGSSSYSYTFFVNVNLTVKPNTTSEVHYPSLDGETELKYETVKADTISTSIETSENLTIEQIDGDNVLVSYTEGGDKKYFVVKKSQLNSETIEKEGTAQLTSKTSIYSKSFNDIWNNFFNKPSDLNLKKEGKGLPRVKFTSTTSGMDSVEVIKAEDLNCIINGSDVTLTLAEGKSAGTVTFNVKKNEVSAVYEVYLIAGEVYTINKNYTISAITEGTKKIDRFNRDSLADKKIFANDRLIALDIPAAIDTALNGRVVTITYTYEKEDKDIEAKTKFLLDTNKKGLTIYIEAGNIVKTIKSIKVSGSDADYKSAWNARTTERITLSYTTKEGPKQIAKSLVEGSVTTTTITGAFNAYDISTLQNTDTTYTATFSLKVNGTEVAGLNSDYNFQQILDIAVGNSYENSFITISVNETRDAKRDLVKLANIHHPSTNLPLSAGDFTNDGVSVSLSILSNLNKEDKLKLLTNNTVYQNHKEDIDKSFNAERTKFLSYTDMRVQDNPSKTWNYLLYGEGATNNGSWALLQFTYTVGRTTTVDGTTKSFYIWVRILPDYDFKVDGTSITVLDGETYSVSNNLNQPYEVTPQTTPDRSAYEVTLTSASGSPILTIVDTNTNSSDKAFNWTYKITKEAEDKGIKYNIDLDKIESNGKSFINESDESKNPEAPITKETINDKIVYTLSTENNGKKEIVLTKQDKNIFGKKLYRIDVSNDYEYKAQIYISFLPENREDPTVHSSSTLSTITEGQYFDIGAVYTQLTLTKSVKDDKTEFDLKTIETKASDSASELNVSYINIAGIDAWGYSGGYISGTDDWNNQINTNQELKTYIKNSNIEKKYLDSSKMLLQYVTIQSIEFLYGENKTEVGRVDTNELRNTKTLATAVRDTLYLLHTTLKEDGSVESITKNLLGTRPMADNAFSVPHLDDWVYSDYATAKNSTDLVPITMRITLYEKRKESGSDYQTETYSLTHDITVKRDLEVDKTKQAVVKDGEAFDLKAVTEGEKYFSYKAGDSEIRDSSSSPISYIDDTLVVTLPASQGKDQNLTVGIEVFNSKDNLQARGSFSIKNTNTRVTSYYNSISKYLKKVKIEDGTPVETGKGYLIKEDDKIKFTFSNFENNDSIIGGETVGTTYYYDKFYATYGMKGNSESNPTAYVTANTWYYSKTTKPAGGTAGTSERDYFKSSTGETTYTLNKTIYYTTSKDAEGQDVYTYNSSAGTEIPAGANVTISDPTNFNIVSNTTCSIKYPVTVDGEQQQIPITDVPVSALKVECTTDNVTVDPQTRDKINIPTSELFSTTRMPEVTKSYIVTVTKGSGLDTAKDHSYRVEKNWIVTPVYYLANSGLSQGSDISARKDADKTGGDVGSGYEVCFATWSNGITYVEGVGNTNLPGRGTGNNSIGDAKKLNIMIGNKETAGTAKVDANGKVTTREGYVPNTEEYIQLVVRVRASGVDGLFAHSTDKDYLLGNLRLFVTKQT